MKLVYVALLGLFLFVAQAFADASSCGDWEPYKYEKCIKVLDDVKPYDDAVKLCHTKEATSSLISINSAEEQTFMENLLFARHKVVDSVWLGARFVNGKYKWADDSEVKFNNWAPGRSLKSADNSCVEMMPDGPSKGKWADEPCIKKNLVVCQKSQTWSLAKLQQILLDTRKQLQDNQNELAAANHKIDNMQKNLIPIGFIYVQLPNEKPPAEVWPTLKWTDVSSSYAGVFFRVEGGESAKFGAVQNADSITLKIGSHRSNTEGKVSGVHCSSGDNLTSTNWILTGPELSHFPAHCIKLDVSSGEMRPKNMAMRVWKRVA